MSLVPRSKVSIFAVVVFCVGVAAFSIAYLKNKTPETVPEAANKIVEKIIGVSVEGRDIISYTYLPAGEAGGNGDKRLVFIGGIHGGYEWNSVLLSYRFLDYLEENPDAIPNDLTITIIPAANPDGVFKVTGKTGRFAAADVSTGAEVLASGRFNANKVDLNRNFDCKWQPEATWQSKTVSAGAKAFSEPESAAIRNFILETNPEAVIFWHSKSNAVYASECRAGILPETLDIMNAYSRASSYRAVKSFDAYEVTGDAEGWLASINIPAITVELETHESLEWEKNLAGIKAIFEYYSREN